MSESIIKVEGLGKKYIISHEGNERYTALRDVISRKAKKLAGGGKSVQKSKEEFWALKDINFEIGQGDAVGVIGRNGAGKSTLLKILSRITEPTTGRIEIKGRIASLLEVGTGFHPELTGRENIFLNGAILGMNRAEIRKKFDEIVDFSGVEKFLDTPVKRYSSGMYVRLAFAVAAHLEPEILLVDEVLAVGDAEFQKKCLGKMSDVSQKEGRTVLFVSHNMGAISALCNRAILLKEGKVERSGETAQVISTYFNNSSGAAHFFDFRTGVSKYSDSIVELLAGCVRGSNNEPKGRFSVEEGFSVVMNYRVKKNIDARVVPNLHLFDGRGNCVFVCNTRDVPPAGEGEYEAVCAIPPDFLNNGVYFINLVITTYFAHHIEVNLEYPNGLSFEIADKLYDNPLRYNYVGEWPGSVRPKLDFFTHKVEDKSKT